MFYHAKYIKDVVAAFGYSTSSIFDIAGKYHVIALFNYNNFIEKAVSASFIYRHGIVWITAYAYVLLYILINNLAVKKKIEIIQIIYLGIYAFDQMLSGGRTALFRMITAILIITVICFGLNKRRNFTKLLFKIVGIIFGIILLLIGINMLLNRTGENSTLNLILESIYVYIGAPIQNLDTYLQGTRHTPELWGSQVFRNIYTYLGGKYGISQYLYQLDLPFLKHNGLNTGNVYTTFYQFYYDFGYDGIVPLMAIIALYFSCAYRKIYNNKPFTIIIYAYLFRHELDNIELIVGDITFPININKKVDWIFHCAAVTTSKLMIEKPVETLSTAIEGTKNILELACKNECKSMVYISSMEMYGTFNNSDTEITEDKIGYINPLKVRSNYPESKRLCENMCVAYMREYGVKVKIARLAQTFGAGILPGENRVFAQFAKSVISGRDIVLHTRGLSEGNYCYTRDCVLGLFIILLYGENGEAYNVANPKSHTTIAEMAHMVADKISNGKIKVIYDIPKDNVFGYAEDTKMKLNSDKLQALGWTPEIGLEDAYKRMIEQMKIEEI